MHEVNGLEQLWPNKWVGKLQALLEKQDYCEFFPLPNIENNNTIKKNLTYQRKIEYRCMRPLKDWRHEILEGLKKAAIKSQNPESLYGVVVLYDDNGTELIITHKRIESSHDTFKDLEKVKDDFMQFYAHKSRKNLMRY